MALTTKDIFTTLLAGLTVWVYYSLSNGSSLPWIKSYRGGVLILLIIGMAMCALSGGGGTVAKSGNWFIYIASALGIAALVLVIYGLVTGAKTAFLLLTGTILLLWAISTLRHFLGK